MLEIGTLAGYSTIALARGVGADGRVVTLEYEPRARRRGAGATSTRAGVDDRVEIVVGAALDTLPTLAERGERVRHVLHRRRQGEQRRPTCEWAVELATPGAVIVVDNIARFGRVLDPAPDDRQARAVRDMFAMMGEHPRLDTAAIQTVGTKGWDGFAVAVIGPEPNDRLSDVLRATPRASVGFS